MATTITWSIDWMQASTQEINGHSEVVLTAGWRCTGADGTVNTSVYGSVSFPEPAMGGTFTPYADLTLDEVLTWVWENGVDKDATEESVSAQVATLANPPTITPPLPW
ncbi:hypothetical protein UFOVP118_75 [uncultured Caudovirales phage]|uniref:DUF7936 domain-containing protein n=1 Tax=uncultured Caudovirales phage TaxID=2100421 RepID=A0A6J5LCQ0_9CAUD|nr:hypothetical protein UFOVP118_75 [uncultured Caudovirales phage]